MGIFECNQVYLGTGRHKGCKFCATKRSPLYRLKTRETIDEPAGFGTTNYWGIVEPQVDHRELADAA